MMDEGGTDVLQESVEKLHALFERTDLETEWKKIRQKIEEARYNPGDLRPLADCIFSLFLAARSNGYGVSAVLEELRRVASDNLTRRWKRMPDGTYHGMPPS